MDHNILFLIFLFVALLILSLGVVIVWFTRKHQFIIYQNKNEADIKEKVAKILQEKNYNIKFKGKKIHVESSRFKALNLHFKQVGNDVKVFKEISESPSGAAFIIVGIFLFGIIALILLQLSDVKSKELSREIYPLLENLN
jgi:hypothetical protein